MKIALPMSILMAAVLAACSSTPTQEPAPVAPAKPGTTVPDTKVTPAPKPPAAKPDPFATPQFKSLMAKTSVFFDYNSFEVGLDYFAPIEAHSKWLKAKPGVSVLIQGNTDERGSSEFNLALGQKRAEAVKGMLKTLGVKDTQMEAVSLGKEKPKNPGHDEAAWAENRRADLIYKGQ